MRHPVNAGLNGCAASPQFLAWRAACVGRRGRWSNLQFSIAAASKGHDRRLNTAQEKRPLRCRCGPSLVNRLMHTSRSVLVHDQECLFALPELVVEAKFDQLLGGAIRAAEDVPCVDPVYEYRKTDRFLSECNIVVLNFCGPIWRQSYSIPSPMRAPGSVALPLQLGRAPHETPSHNACCDPEKLKPPQATPPLP